MPGKDNRGRGGDRFLTMKSLIVSALASLLIAASLLAQAKPAQVIASIPTEKADISVASGEGNSVILTIGDASWSLNAAEAARLSRWIKEGDNDAFSGNDRIAMKRKNDSFVLMAPAGSGTTKMELRKEWAYQLAQALESGRKTLKAP